MATIQHDKDGFLAGNAPHGDTERNDDLAENLALDIWRGIQSDTAAIRKSLVTQSEQATKAARVATPARVQAENKAIVQQLASITKAVQHGNREQRVSTPVARVRGTDGRFLPIDKSGTVATPQRASYGGSGAPESPKMGRATDLIGDTSGKLVRMPGGTKQIAQAVQAASENRSAFPNLSDKIMNVPPAVPGKVRQRGDDGRFAGASDLAQEANIGRATEFLGDAAGRLASVADRTEQIDPTIAAANEIKSVVTPIAETAVSIGKGVFGFFKRDKGEGDQAVPWYKKILKELKILNEDKPGGSGGSGFLSSIFGGIGSGISRVMGWIGGIMGTVGSGLSGLLKALPFLAKLAGPLAAIYSAVKSFGTSTEEYAKRMGLTAGESLSKDIAIRVAGVLGDLGNTLTLGLAGKFGEIIAPAVGTMIEKITGTWDATVEWIKGKWDSAISLIEDAGNWIKTKYGVAKTAVSNAVETAKATANKANETIKAKTGIDVKDTAGKVWEGAKNAVRRVIEAGKGYNVIQRPDGTVERQEGARNWRNNNPGNIEYGEFAKKQGAIGSDGRFAIFPSYDAGRKAKESLIFDGKGYKDKTLTDAIARYAPPGENNTAAYQSNVLASVGGANKRMSEYTAEERTAIMNAMERVEGFKVGKTTTLAHPGITTGNHPWAGSFKPALAGQASQVPSTASAKPATNATSASHTASPSPVATASAASIMPHKVPTTATNATKVSQIVVPSAVSAVSAAPSTPQVPSAAPDVAKMQPPPAPTAPPTKLNGGGKCGQSVTVNIPREIGQNVSDRGIAQVVTGGLGRYPAFSG